ncbi:hypothetical protein ASPZODRAFT_1914444 [Penicilliopsis zonata CBS 506.65]|uniref:DUF7082 domain-containing protein n=1 Tax=Penicilliopsis zonata CBS 506.65 TaxID=1073090 RepID=A0A1L9SJD6_9EURO|nr:hypothetical protein ASPZODRAFT_1914444 [Penicilliopsis zonata CBS 506.65]OJJ47203.1 hypothetical protein ASPZODRAFT_1914444 [Penicilliopsis zonata CBS 506.65]
MAAFPKHTSAALIDYGASRSLQDGVPYPSYGQPQYVPTQLVPSPMVDQVSQVSDCVPYLTNQDYASSYEEARSPMLLDQSQPVPEVLSYTPQRGGEGTRVFVQIQSPYDLHTSSYAALFLVFGTKKCECIPHFLGFQGSAFQYGLSVDAPDFMLTGSPSFAVPLQVSLHMQEDALPTTTLQVGVYTYEHATAHSPPSDESKKRRIPTSFSEPLLAPPSKRASMQTIPMSKDTLDTASHHELERAGSYSPFLPALPTVHAVPGYAASSYAPSPSGRLASIQYANVSAPGQPTLRAPSPLTPTWSPASYVPVACDTRATTAATTTTTTTGLTVSHSLRQQKAVSPAARAGNPTLIRTSTLQTATNLSHAQPFNPYAMYPSKAVLKLNGDLDAMAEGWSKDEREARRRLVQFTRAQNGSTIHADFKPVAPEDRAPNSICISCIYWDGKDECFVTSVDTIYLLESLVGVRFTVEEKNRIRRNLEGFRPLTVSKAKADSEDFFKVIMGFPAPKPRNIEKDVKVFPWKILAHALKKIIGKYSASYSSTASALPASIASNFASHPATSDSGAETNNMPSPQSVSDSAQSSTYGASLTAPVYSPSIDPSVGPADFRSMLPAASHPYGPTPSAYAYAPHAHPGHPAPIPRHSSWDIHPVNVNGASAPTAVTSYYVPPVSYPILESSNGL